MTNNLLNAQHHTSFTDEQFELIYPEGVEKHYWNVARNKIVQHKIQHRLVPGMMVLDLGCGPGLVVEFLRAQGIVCFGVDPASAPVHAQDKAYLRFNTRSDELPLESRKSVGVVLLLDVIEHIETPEVLLASLPAAFPNMTTLVITVPARQELWSDHDTYNAHFRRYDVRSLRGLLIGAGYHVLEYTYFFHALYVPARVMRFLGISRRPGFSAPHGRFTMAMHRALGKYFVLESTLFPKSIPGSSLLAVAELKKDATGNYAS